MSVIIGPPRRSILQRLLGPVLLLAALAGITLFLIYRFGDTPVEKAEKLFLKKDLEGLQAFTRKKLEKGEVNPLLYSYFAVAEFSMNPRASLAGLLGNIKAVDDRPVFRREALHRILQVPANLPRAGEILAEALKLEQPPGDEMKVFIQSLLQSEASLAGDGGLFTALKELFPKYLRRVKAKELQWRQAPSTEGAVIRRLADKEELLIRQQGQVTTVSGKKGAWVLALDENMQSGWVFDAYLEKMPE
ncbi:MAG: hypothetical protein J0L53_18645 [Spirochaetes bacterium]|nr:hypothetical protein [Spirochaetota bacterium]MBX3721928.1 hypothetical protein [Turneriella sp.]